MQTFSKIKVLIADDDPVMVDSIIIDMLPIFDNNKLSLNDKKELISQFFDIKVDHLAIDAEKRIDQGFYPDIALIDINFSNYKENENRVLSDKERKKELTMDRGITTILHIKNHIHCKKTIVAGYTHFDNITDIYKSIKKAGYNLEVEFDTSNPHSNVYRVLKTPDEKYLVSQFFRGVLRYMGNSIYHNLSGGSKKTVTAYFDEKKRLLTNELQQKLLKEIVRTNDGRSFEVRSIFLGCVSSMNELGYLELEDLRSYYLGLCEKSLFLIERKMPAMTGDWEDEYMQQAFVDFITFYIYRYDYVKASSIELVSHYFDIHCDSNKNTVNHNYSRNFRCTKHKLKRLDDDSFQSDFINNLIIRLSLSIICRLNNNENLSIRFIDKIFTKYVLGSFVQFINNDGVYSEEKIQDDRRVVSFNGRIGMTKLRGVDSIDFDNLSGLEQKAAREIADNFSHPYIFK